MAIALDMRSADFEPRFAALLGAKRESSPEVDAAVAAIIADVRARGDEALADYSRRFDRVDTGVQGLAIGAGEIEAAIAACEPGRAQPRSNSRTSAWSPTIGARSQPTCGSPTRSGSNSAGAGGRSRRSVSMFPAERRAIRLRS